MWLNWPATQTLSVHSTWPESRVKPNNNKQMLPSTPLAKFAPPLSCQAPAKQKRLCLPRVIILATRGVTFGGVIFRYPTGLGFVDFSDIRPTRMTAVTEPTDSCDRACDSQLSEAGRTLSSRLWPDQDSCDRPKVEAHASGRTR